MLDQSFIHELQLSGNDAEYSYDPKNKKLTIRKCKRFPEHIFKYPDQIELLDMSSNGLSEIPSGIGKLTKMKVAFFSENKFDRVPAVLSGCPNLQMIGLKSCGIGHFDENCLPKSIRWITLTDNKIAKLPNFLNNLSNLEKFLISGNNLSSLPDSLEQCQNLSLIRLSSNSFRSLPPDWLFRLPRLSWYSDTGNKYSPDKTDLSSSISPIDWNDLTISRELSKNAKNTIYEAKVRRSGQLVAVKLFGGGITSDGSATSEIEASIAIVGHPNIIHATSILKNAPDGKKGIVLPLIPNEYRNLGQPPDFTTVTRDTFRDGVKFNKSFIINCLRDVCSANLHIHSKHISNGDLYAHNILSDTNGRSILGDFGASSFYKQSDAKFYESVDVRAFGYLISDFLNHSDKHESSLRDKLSRLKDSCVKSSIDSYISFREIQEFITQEL